MRRHLHLLHPLRCFESASRHLSFTKAAAELRVTQAAVSHQIRLLEASLGTRLFDRLARSVMLTPAGERLADVVSDSLARIDTSVELLMQAGGDEQGLQLGVPSGLSSRWLVPRLPALHARYPEFALHLHHVSRIEDIDWTQVEAAVVWVEPGPEPAPWNTLRATHAHAQRFLETALTPVCAPELMTPERRLAGPAALRHLPLLHEDGFEHWERWMKAAGASEVPVRRGTIIDDSSALLMAAAAGQGVALARTVLIEEDLRRGRLVAPFATEIPAPGAYWLIARGTVRESARYLAVCEFLQGEAARQARVPAPLARAA
jgi:LysR family glycine cleavage system transcriptional activator